MSCCTVDHKRKKCVDVGRDDSGCVDLAKCCVGIHNIGKHNKCLSKVRECRKLGNAWDPIGPLKPMPFEYIYTDTPGYSTTGSLVEGFDGSMFDDLVDIDCIAKNFACSLIIALAAKAVFGKGVTISQILILTLVISIIKCCAAKF